MKALGIAFDVVLLLIALTAIYLHFFGAQPAAVHPALVCAALGGLVVPGFDVSPTAYSDAEGRLVTTPPLPVVCWHEFKIDDGAMAHYIDGTLRAVVTPENLDGYVKQWPAAAPIAQKIREAITVAASNGEASAIVNLVDHGTHAGVTLT